MVFQIYLFVSVIIVDIYESVQNLNNIFNYKKGQNNN